MDPLRHNRPLDEAAVAALAQQMVTATAPRLFALVTAYGERADGWRTAWGLAFDDQAVLIGGSDRPQLMLFDSVELAHRRLAQLGPVHLVWP
jgi:hypothetical protein